jgi:hypothetical protein
MSMTKSILILAVGSVLKFEPNKENMQYSQMRTGSIFLTGKLDIIKAHLL